MRYSVILLCSFLLIPLVLHAQEQLGLRTGNYAGINGWALNPSAHTSTPFNWEFNLAEGAFFFDNNYAFLQQTRLLDFARNPKQLNYAFGPDFDEETPPPAGSIVLDFEDDGRRRYANGLASIGGPALFVRLNEQHAIGLFTRARAFASGRGIVNEFSYYQYFNRPFVEPFEVDPFKMSVATWSELGLNYLFQTSTGDGKLGVGISARMLQGYEAIYLNNRTAFSLAKLPGDTLTGGPIQFQYGHTNSNLQSTGHRLQPNGLGAAIDVGATYLIGDENDYSWRLGFSILDIGRLQFSRNSRLHQVNTSGTSIIGFEDYSTFRMPDELEPMLELFSAQTLGDPSASLQNTGFGMWLPAALSIQVDRNLGQGFYLNAVLVQGIPVGEAHMRRGGLIGFTPRFERRWIAFAMPVSLHQGNHLQLGLAGRLGFLTLGTDRLGSFFTKSDLSGTDFYFALKIQPFRLQSASSKEKDPRSGNGTRGLKAARVKVGGGNVKCYKF